MEKVLIEKLRNGNLTANNGRGSSTIHTVLQYIDRGVYGSARDHWMWDSDKVVQYPELFDIANELFGTTFSR